MEDVAIYARFSSDKQSEASIADQFRLCENLVDRNGWNLVSCYSDGATSGSVPIGKRNGSAQLLKAAERKEFGVLILESLDRLSRDSIESQQVIRNLEFNGIRIVCVSDGYDSQMKGNTLMRAMRSAMGEMYLEDLADKTHRGMSGQVERGFAAGASAYGYQNVKVEGGSDIQIIPEQAEIVNWIYKSYVSGMSPHKIAAELNRQKISPPRGKSWHVSAIYGCPKKGCGILNNEMYNGKQVWNRSEWVKDPVSKKRVRRERPREELIVKERPELRVVSPELWRDVRDRFEKSRIKGGTRGSGGKAKTLFGGLISCGLCGGSVIAINANYYGCSNRRDRGKEICDGVNIAKKKAEDVLLSEIREMLCDPAVVEYVYQEVKRLFDGAATNEVTDKESVLCKISDLELVIEKYIEAIGMIGVSDSLAKKLKDAEFEKKELYKQLDVEKREWVLPSKKSIKKQYDKKVVSLQKTLKSEVEIARNCLSEILGDIVLKKQGLKPLPR